MIGETSIKMFCRPCNMEIRSRMEHLPRLRRFVRDFCMGETGCGLLTEYVWELELAVHEAASNIIRHAYENRKNRSIAVEIGAFEAQIRVRLSHWGKPFTQPHKAPSPVLHGEADCGFGLYLIDRCVDRITYEHTPDGKNIVSLIKLLDR